MTVKNVIINSFCLFVNLVALYLRRFQKYELVGPWRHDCDVKGKGKGPKPPTSPSDLSPSSSPGGGSRAPSLYATPPSTPPPPPGFERLWCRVGRQQVSLEKTV